MTPDGDKLTYKWWQYEEVGTYTGKIAIKNVNRVKASFILPNDIKQGETIHLILEVSDSKTPQQTRYQRVIVKSE